MINKILLTIGGFLVFVISVLKMKNTRLEKKLDEREFEIKNTRENAKINAKVSTIPFSELSSGLRKSKKRRD